MTTKTQKRVYGTPDNYHSDLYNFLIKLKNVYGNKLEITLDLPGENPTDAVFHISIPEAPKSKLRKTHFVYANILTSELDQVIAMKWAKLASVMDDISWRLDEWATHREKVEEVQNILKKLSNDEVDLVFKYVNGTL